MRAGALPRFRFPTFGLGPQVVAVVLVVGLVGAMAIQPTRQLVEQRARISGMADDLTKLEHTNLQLEREISRLNDPDFIEQRAREVGLVREGEISLMVVPPGDNATRSGPEKDKPTQPVVDDPGFWQSFFGFIGF